MEALNAALLTNPHLTSLPHPRADIIAPRDITHTTGTAEILRSPEVRTRISGDFLLLPCDLVCEMPGELLVDSWMMRQRPMGTLSIEQSPHPSRNYTGFRNTTRGGGIGVWYNTKGDDYVKGAETDFIIAAQDEKPVARPPLTLLRSNLSKLLYTCTTDTLRDTLQEQGGFPLRTGILRKHGNVKMLMTCRAAHVYIFPHWMLQVIEKNTNFDNVSEDVIGWWAKASWQDGLAEKLQMREAFLKSGSKAKTSNQAGEFENPDINKPHMSKDSSTVPNILAYMHPTSSSYLIRRVDTPALLLSTSLYLAALPPLESATESAPPYAHKTKISTDASLIAQRTTIDSQTTLVAPNTTVAKHCTIKSSCIGASCGIGEGVKITGSLLMDGVIVKDKASLQGCILGRRCIIGKGAKLEGCEVQEGYKIEDGTVGSKGDKFCVFEGLENGLTSMQGDESGDDNENESS